MSLAEIPAVDTDTDTNSTIPLFLVCTSSPPPSSSPLHLQLLDGSSLFEGEVSSSHKPRALACSPLEYLTAVQSALSPLARGQQPRFDFRWSRADRTLTLMERAGFAMKFSAVQFERVTERDAAEKWRQLLHLVAAQQAQRREEREEREEKVLKLEKLLQRKETLLEAALAAKQQQEDALFRGFCAVLNGKKDEIRRLQSELDRVQQIQSYESSQVTKRKGKVAPPKRARKATAAKLKKKKQEEEQDEDMSEEDSSKEESGEESTITEEEAEDDEGNERKRAKRDAINAYSQLPASVKPSSVQISSAEDLLSSMDDIIKNEDEANEATQRGEISGRGVKTEPVAKQSHSMELSKLRSCISHAKKAIKVKSTPPPKPEPVKQVRPTPPVDEAMDSEEEDILDMLS